MKISSAIFYSPQGDNGIPGDVGSFGAQGEKVTHKTIILWILPSPKFQLIQARQHCFPAFTIRAVLKCLCLLNVVFFSHREFAAILDNLGPQGIRDRR